MVEYLAYPLLMLTATPLFLRYLGSEQYGQWMLLVTLGNLGGLAGLGMGAATTKDVSAALGRGDTSFAVLAVRVSSLIALACSAAAGLLLAICWMLWGASHFARMGSPAELQPLVLMAAGLLAFEQLDSVYTGALRGLERFDVSARVEMMARFAIVIAALGTAAVSRRLEWVLAVYLTLTFMRAAAKAHACARLMGGVALWPTWERTMARHVLSFGQWSWLQSLGSALFSVVDRLIIGSVLGADALAHFSVCLQLAQQVQALPAAASSFLFPMFSRKLQSGQPTHGQVLKLTLLLGTFGAAIALPLVLFGHELLGLWVGLSIADSSSGLLALLALAHWVLVLCVPSHYFLFGANLARFVALVGLGAGTVSSLLNVLLIPVFGLAAAAGARAVYGLLVLAGFAVRLRLPLALTCSPGKVSQANRAPERFPRR
jgi:O-antigen/teichoic acid export membrane protein